MPKPLYTILLYFIICAAKGQNSGLVARYSFNNGDAGDDLGKHNARTYGAKLTEDRFGNDNSAYLLQGNPDSYINLGSDSCIKPAKGTISLWVKINQPIYKGTGIDHNIIITTRAHGGEDFNDAFFIGYHLELKNINVDASLSERDQVTLYPAKITSLRTWHHVAITYDNAFLCFYLDGILENKAAKNFESTFLKGDSILVGKKCSIKNNRYLNGCVDDIEIYDRVLSPTEISALYNAPNPNRSRLIVRWILFCLGLLALIIIIIFLIRRYIRRVLGKEKEKIRLRMQWYEQENKVLKAQMNPHFIFNSLNTIQQFIIINDNKKAQLYLTKFSRLIRKLLESNTRDKISLAEEIELCEKYLEIESLRFSNSFNYTFHIKNIIDPASVFIPHFLIQVFIENAVWHGLLPKKNDRQLLVSFERMNAYTLCCVVDDNGVGRQARKTDVAGEEGKKSLAINFVKQRLSMFSIMYGHNYEVIIEDKLTEDGQSDGTKIILTIPVIQN